MMDNKKLNLNLNKTTSNNKFCNEIFKKNGTRKEKIL